MRLCSRLPPMDFNPRSPRGERRVTLALLSAPRIFQSTLPARGATPLKGCPPTSLGISIHAPREGSDDGYLEVFGVAGDFNPRSPRGERRFQAVHGLAVHGFQSTLPARGATIDTAFCRYGGFNFNPRSPRGERLNSARTVLILCLISIHAPREGSDRPPGRLPTTGRNFNPRSPRGERRLRPGTTLGTH